MRKVGVTTVQRWLSEKVDWGVKSYMESDGKLYELSTITGANGGIAVTLVAEFKLHAATFFAGHGNYTLQSTVFLYAGADDLAGLAVDSVEFADLGMTIACVNSARAVGQRFNIAGAVSGRVECGGERNVAAVSHPHCG